MPVKIIDGVTNKDGGQINISDLNLMKTDFFDDASLIPTGTRPFVVQTAFCFLFKSQVDELFANHPEASILKINFALHLDPTVGCQNDDYSNSLTVVIEAALDNPPGSTVFNNLNDFVLIPAFNNETVSTANENAPEAIAQNFACCPSQSGGRKSP